MVMHLGGMAEEPRTLILHAHEIEKREAIVAGFDQQIDVAFCRSMVSCDGAVEEKTCNTETSKTRAVVSQKLNGLIAAHRSNKAGKASAVTAAASTGGALGVHRDGRSRRPSASGGSHEVHRVG